MLLNISTEACISKAVIKENLSVGNQSVNYFTYKPAVIKSHTILVLIHGISRNAEEMIDATTSLADELGVVSLAPLFDSVFCKDYQRLGRMGKGPRADFMLQLMISKLSHQYGLVNSKLIMIGNSGGAQFTQRYAFAYPESVRNAILIAPGWFTFPKNLKFPYGLNRTKLLPDLRFKIKSILKVPFKVLVGDLDVEINTSLNQSKHVIWQGENRVSRAKKWILSMQSAAVRHNMEINTSIELIEGGKHEFKQLVVRTNLLELIRSWLA